MIVRTLKSLETECMSCVGSFWPPGNWSRVGQRICCDNAFLFTIDKEKRSRHRRCAFVERQRESPEGSLKRKVDLAVREEREAQQKLYQAEAEGWGEKLSQREIMTLLFEISIKNLNLSDFTYIKQIDVQINLKETSLACMEKWEWETNSSKKIKQKIAKKLKNCIIVYATTEESNDCESRWWLKFWIYRTK